MILMLETISFSYEWQQGSGELQKTKCDPSSAIGNIYMRTYAYTVS